MAENALKDRDYKSDISFITYLSELSSIVTLLKIVCCIGIQIDFL